MDHHFEIQDAHKYGVIAAVILYNLKYWVLKNKANHINFHDGRTWTYNSIEAFRKIFPYFSIWQIRYALKKLVVAGVLLKGNYNKVKYDRTIWYAFKDEKTALKGFKPISEKPQMEHERIANGGVKSHKPIANPKPHRSPDRNKKVEPTHEERLRLDLRIAEGRNHFCNELGKIFHLTKNEQKTFARITKYLVDLCQTGKAERSIFKDAIEWAKEAKASTAQNKKGLFVAKVKRETGFKAQKQLLN